MYENDEKGGVRCDEVTFLLVVKYFKRDKFCCTPKALEEKNSTRSYDPSTVLKSVNVPASDIDIKYNNHSYCVKNIEAV